MYLLVWYLWWSYCYLGTGNGTANYFRFRIPFCIDDSTAVLNFSRLVVLWWCYRHKNYVPVSKFRCCRSTGRYLIWTLHGVLSVRLKMVRVPGYWNRWRVWTAKGAVSLLFITLQHKERSRFWNKIARTCGRRELYECACPGTAVPVPVPVSGYWDVIDAVGSTGTNKFNN